MNGDVYKRAMLLMLRNCSNFSRGKCKNGFILFFIYKLFSRSVAALSVKTKDAADAIVCHRVSTERRDAVIISVNLSSFLRGINSV